MNPDHWFARLMSEDQRVCLRCPSPRTVAFYWGGGESKPHAIRDYSASGIYVVTEERWYPGTIIAMTLTRTGRRVTNVLEAIRVKAMVVRAGPDGVGFAFVFPYKTSRRLKDGFPPEVDMDTLEQFIARSRTDTGQALVEYLLLLPMLFLLIVNVVNVGGFFFAWITVADAARSAADYAILGGASAGSPRTPVAATILALTTTDVSSLPNNTTLTVNICKNFNGTITTVSGTCSSMPSDSEPLSYALTSIDVTYTYKPLIPAGFQFKGLNVYVTIPPTVVHRRAVMRVMN